MIALLHLYGANINYSDYLGITPLEVSIAHNHTLSTALLILFGSTARFNIICAVESFNDIFCEDNKIEYSKVFSYAENYILCYNSALVDLYFNTCMYLHNDNQLFPCQSYRNNLHENIYTEVYERLINCNYLSLSNPEYNKIIYEELLHSIHTKLEMLKFQTREPRLF